MFWLRSNSKRGTWHHKNFEIYGWIFQIYLLTRCYLSIATLIRAGFLRYLWFDFYLVTMNTVTSECIGRTNPGEVSRWRYAHIPFNGMYEPCAIWWNFLKRSFQSISCQLFEVSALDRLCIDIYWLNPVCVCVCGRVCVDIERYFF